ncbi:MAG: transketolase [Polyangiaceae bacterium]|nr:transketolase [Polyangiaceae bacterium]
MTLRLADHCGLRLAELADEDARLWVLDGDLADSDGAVHFAKRHPERFIMGGIAEQGMVSLAAGMASCGLRPWVFSFAAFLCYRACDQIRVCLGQARQPVTLVGSHSGGCSGRNGKTHAAISDVAILASLPGVRVWAPADPADVRLAIRSILDGAEPAYLRLPRTPVSDLGGAPLPFRWLSPPGPIVIVSTGLGTQLAVAAREHLRARGIAAGHLHCPELAPLPAALPDELRGAAWVFAVEDHSVFGGLASLLQALGLRAPVIPIGWPAGWSVCAGADEDVLEMGGLSGPRIAATIADVIAGRRGWSPSMTPSPGE